jgi:hypothetical protein
MQDGRKYTALLSKFELMRKLRFQLRHDYGRLRFRFKITVMITPFLISLIYNPIGYVTN